jgi:hypothetical protein
MDVYEPQQIVAYEQKENSAVIWRCFSRDRKAEIPEQIEGLTVTAVAPYAFSAHMDGHSLQKGLQSGQLRLSVPTLYQGTDVSAIPALCADQLEEVVFPGGVRHVGRYCFYNCSSLHRITFHGTLSDWGSGVFTGCHQVRELCVYTDTDRKSALKDVLDELPEELQVDLRTGTANEARALLIFPEFFEEGVENTPARILETRIHGSGVRYRNCFAGRTFDFGQYDQIFPYAVAQEAPQIAGRLAMNRLRYPLGLSDAAAEMYRTYILEHPGILSGILIREQDYEGLRALLDLIRASGSNPAGSETARTQIFDEMIGQAAGMEDAQATSILMEYRRTSGSAGNKRKRMIL